MRIETLIFYRKELKITQKQLSEIVGCPLSTIKSWESGKRQPPSYVLDLIKFKLDTIKGRV